jgi:hypothetical protein
MALSGDACRRTLVEDLRSAISATGTLTCHVNRAGSSRTQKQ